MILHTGMFYMQITHFFSMSQTALPGRFSWCFFHLRCVCRGSITGQWSNHVRSFDVRSIFMWRDSMRRVRHGSHHIEHCVITFVCHSWMQKSTANAPRTLSPIIETAYGPWLSLFWSRIVSVTKLSLLQFWFLFLSLLPFFLVIYFSSVFCFILVFIFTIFLCTLFALFRDWRFNFTCNFINYVII